MNNLEVGGSNPPPANRISYRDIQFMVKGQKYHILYRTTCTVTENFYIGVHSTTNLEDGYMGSGIRLLNSVLKHGKENHTREILEFFDTREDLMKREIEVVNDELLKEEKCMNLKKGGDGGFRDEEHRKRAQEEGGRKVFQLLAKRHIEKLKTDDIYRKRYSEKISKSKREKNSFKGKTHTESFKKKMSEIMSIKQQGENNSQYGTCWIFNDTESIRIKKEKLNFYLLNGWKNGRKMKQNKSPG